MSFPKSAGAIADFDKLIELTPADAAALRQRGQAKLQKGTNLATHIYPADREPRLRGSQGPMGPGPN